MRKKHRARGRAERAALEQVAAQAGVEIADAPGDPPEARTLDEGEATVDEAGERTVDEAGTTTDDDRTIDEAATATDDDDRTIDEGGTATGDDDRTLDEVARAEVTGGEADTGGALDDGAAAAEGDAGGNGDEALGADQGLDADEAEDDADEVADPARPQAAALDDARFKALVEALVFAADKPLTIARLRQLTRVSDTRRIQAALDALQAEHADRGIVLSAISGGYSFRTHASFSTWVQQLIAGRPVRLSRAQLETLAIVAYRQPITRPEIDQIRGVDSGATLKLLLDRSLIRILGKREEVGRPLLYGTTKEFLDFFSLSELRELPTLREYSELTAESRSVVAAKLGVEAPPPAAVPEPGDATAEAPGEQPMPASETGGEVDAIAADEAATEPAPEPAAAPEREPEGEPAAEPAPPSEPEREPDPAPVEELPDAPAAGEPEVNEPEPADATEPDPVAEAAAETAAAAASGDEGAA
jgi:segregation and condensation protein B